ANQQPDFLGYDGGSQYLRDRRAQELRQEHQTMTNWAAIIQEEGIEAEGFLISGKPVETLLEKAESLQIDLIICGHHEHSPLYELFVGSHSAKLIRRSKIPVMVVPFDDRVFE
ncbi:MAG: universal stress protein, partial [Chloroflexota bacterium]